MIGKYKLVGISKPKSATLERPNGQLFWATIEMAEDRINALWDYCKGDWTSGKIATIKFDIASADGTPVDAKLIDIEA